MTGSGAMPPHDLAAEMAVLGSMMLSADALADCLEVLTPGQECFFRPAHQMAYEAIRFLADDAQPVDALTVKAEMERRGELSRAGGADYLHTLIASVPAPANGAYYARKLLVLHTRRAVGVASGQIGMIANDPALSREEIADAAHEALDRATGLSVTTRAVPVPALLGPALERLEAGPDTTTGILTGWREVDRVIPGFRPGELIVVGGRPSMGKSIVLLNVAVQVGVHMQRPVLVCSLEMSRDECMERMISSVAGVALTAIRDRLLSDHDWDRIQKVHARLNAAETLVIEDNPDVSVQGIRAELRAMRRAGTPAELVIVDYLQLMTASGKRTESRQLEVSGFSRDLKKLAREFEVPVMVGAQLNRGPEQRNEHKPLLADLRESGALENDCDIAILLYRDDMYYEDSPRSGEIDLIIAKNRQGARVTVPLAFRGHFAECADLYRDSAEGEWSPTSALDAQSA
jgi:replicative DNA helicase